MNPRGPIESCDEGASDDTLELRQGCMDHEYIDEFDIVDRYLMGKLAAEESAQFEEHFVDCPQCIERLRTTKDFIQGLRVVAVEQAKAPNQSESTLPWHLSRMMNPRVLALAAACLLLAIAGVVIVVSHLRALRLEVDQARSVAAEWERRFEQERQAAAKADLSRQEAERELTGQINELRKRLDAGEAAPHAQPEGWSRPQVNLAILVLRALRAADPSSADSANTLTLPQAPSNFVITLPLEGETHYADYRVTITDRQGHIVWRRRGFRPDRYNSLSAGFNSSLFQTGDYLLTAEGLAQNNDSTVIGEYLFRIIRGR